MHQKEVTHSNGSYERKSRGQKLADEMGWAKKFPWYTHRLMHWKRVTSELHDSYFHLMTIKHAISKIEWAIEWASRTVEFRLSWVPESWRRSYRRDVVGKATSGQRGLEARMSWGPEKMLIRCSKESQHPAEWTPGPLVEHQENEKDTTLTAIRVGGQNISVLFGLQLPVICKPWIPFLNPYNKVRGTYFSKEVFLRLLFIASVCIQHEHVYMRMQHQQGNQHFLLLGNFIYFL